MRTKTLLLTAALSAAGVMAQMAGAATFSVNVVGYINVTVPPGFTFIANQLSAQNEKISALITAPPSGTVVYTWLGGFSANSFDLFGDKTWDDPDLILTPGNGGLIFNPTAAAFTITFVGEVKQGTLTTAIPDGFSFISSQVPQAGGLATVLGYTPKSGDVFYKWDGGFSANTYDLFGDKTWETGTEPTLDVGQSGLLFSNGAASWTRTFNVP